MKLAEQIERMEENSGACKVLVGMSEGKRPLGRPSSTCTDSNKSHWIGRLLVLIQKGGKVQALGKSGLWSELEQEEEEGEKN
jgi:hypothetical protein